MLHRCARRPWCSRNVHATEPPGLAAKADNKKLFHSQTVRVNLHGLAVVVLGQLHGQIRFTLLNSPEAVPDGPSRPLLSLERDHVCCFEVSLWRLPKRPAILCNPGSPLVGLHAAST